MSVSRRSSHEERVDVAIRVRCAPVLNPRRRLYRAQSLYPICRVLIKVTAIYDPGISVVFRRQVQ